MAIQKGQEGGQDPAIDIVTALMRIERGLRELASDLQLRRKPFREVESGDILRIQEAELELYSAFEREGSWFQNVAKALTKTDDAPEDLGPDVHVNVLRLREFYRLASSSLEKAKYVAHACEGFPYDDDFCIHVVRSEGVQDVVKELMNEVRSLTGRECGFGLRIPEKRRRYDLPSLLNDVSNCVHVVAEWLPRSGLPSTARRVGERCFALGDADQDLLDLCSIWDRKVGELKEKGAYTEGDYNELGALVGPGEASFRVGSSYKHATRVRRDGRLVYYDKDVPVVNAVKYLMESAGYSCTIPSYDMLECTPPSADVLKNREAREKIADVMGWVTSADIRLSKGFRSFCESECRNKMGTAGKDDFWKCVHGCASEIYDEEAKKREEAVRGARIRPHPVAELDFEKYGITWWRGGKE
jgi:hypothetical protein